jgi:hypothetical protein
MLSGSHARVPEKLGRGYVEVALLELNVPETLGSLSTATTDQAAG